MGALEIRQIITSMIVLIASVGLHEWGHAFMATKLGDDTPSRQGRLTLNPFAHADPIGTILLPLISAISAVSGGGGGGFGWGKPVMHNPTRFNRRISMRTGSALVAIAGPLMNVVLALGLGLAAVLVDRYGGASSRELAVALALAVLVNFSLFFFNLLPTPPLDGGWIASRFMPARFESQWQRISAYGPFIVAAFVMISPLRKVFAVPAMYCTQAYLSFLAGIF